MVCLAYTGLKIFILSSERREKDNCFSFDRIQKRLQSDLAVISRSLCYPKPVQRQEGRGVRTEKVIDCLNLIKMQHVN